MSADNEGEEWKNEPEEKPIMYSGLFSSWAIPTPTPEQVEAERRRKEDAQAKAEILFASLPLFDAARRCPKCHNPKPAKTRHCVTTPDAGYHYAGGCKGETGTHEHFHRTCKLCRYDWLERCLGEE